MDLISVIIPCFNVEAVLDKCIESVITQTYTSLEIILVDDGSRDATPDICRKWAGIDKRINFIEQKNNGVSAARNRAMELASGDYYSFIDSDDMISENYIETLYKMLKDNDADLAGCCFEWIDFEDNRIKRTLPPAVVFEGDNNDFLERMYDNIVTLVPAWGKLAKKTVYKGVEFPEGKVHEDGFICREIAEHCHKIVWTDKRLYMYRVNKNGISQNVDSQNIQDDFDWIEQDIEYFSKNNNIRLLGKACKTYCYKAIYWWKKMNIDDKKMIHKKYLKYVKNILKDQTITVKAKAKYGLYSMLLFFI